MKRTLCLIVLFLLLLTASVHAADTRTVRVEALDLSIDVPAKCYALTPDMDPFRFSTVGFHQHIYTFDEVMAMQDQMKEMGAALRVWTTDPAFNCLLEASPIQMQSMDLLDDAALDEMLEQGIPELTNEFMTITGSSLFRTEHTVFIRYEAQAEYDGVQEQIIIYGTVHDYQMLGLTVGYAGELMPEKYRTIADEMAASLRFGEDAEPAVAAAEEGKTQAAEPTEAFRYDHSETGVSFTVPAGWTEISTPPGVGNPGTVKATFIHGKGVDPAILFSCRDLMDKLPDALKQLDRALVNQDVISLDLIFGDPGPFEINRKATETIGGREFYVVEYTEPTNQVVETDVICIENGYEYSFEFSGNADSPFYADFLSLVESAEFPDAETAAALADAPAGTLDAGQPVSPIGNPDLSFRIGYIVGCATRAVLVIAGIVVCVILLRKNKKNKNTRRQDGAAPAAPTNPAVPAKRVCAACGADLGPDEKFCPFCGTKAE